MAVLIILLHNLLLFSTSSYSNTTVISDRDKTYYIADCTILDSEFKVVRTLLPSNICLPLEDGSFIATNTYNYLKKISPLGEVIWERKGYYHHQISRTSTTNILVLRTIEIKKVLYNEVCEIDSKTGKDLRVFSVYKSLQKDKKKFARFDQEPFPVSGYLDIFTTNIEKTHINSVSQFKNEYIVNEINRVSFILDSKFKFLRFIDLDVINFPGMSPAVHDLQKTSDDQFIIFKNFNEDPKTKAKTFKIFEFDEKKISFEFPTRPEDFVQSDFSGGVQKIGDTYLTGFPIKEGQNSSSFVALISNKGFYIKKGLLPFRIQDIKKIPFDNFMNTNKMK